jgi:chemotaxis protein methyltransferase CheR
VALDTAVTPPDFAFVRQLVRERSGLVLADGKEYLVAARLNPIVRRESLGSIGGLVSEVRKGSIAFRDELVEAMATNETSFFRDARPFDFLRDELIPAMVRARPTAGLRIWSAAASTGQEAYSLAMLLREHFPRISPATILATDLCRDVLDVAEAGSFSQLEVNRGLPATLLVRYFRREGLRWEVTPPVRAMVTFRQINLTRPLPVLPTMDVVFLRNVLIYFDEATKADVLTRVAGVLRPGGYLILGSAETLRHLDGRYERVQSDRTVCYRLRERADA